MSRKKIIALVIVIASFILAALVYPLMPSKVASHWNAQGEVDGYMSKSWGLFLMPAFSLAIFLLFLILPKIDPLKKNYQKFKAHYEGFILVIIGFFFYLYIITLMWNANMKFSINQMLVPAFAILFYYSGVLMEKAKRNWFVGIRTPWTLSSKAVWDKTHRIGGQLFKLSAVVVLLGLLSDKLLVYIVVIPIAGSSIFLIAYSYFEYQKVKRK